MGIMVGCFLLASARTGVNVNRCIQHTPTQTYVRFSASVGTFIKEGGAGESSLPAVGNGFLCTLPQPSRAAQHATVDDAQADVGG